jgi:2-polyprenyl-3-methyl-5-hydroxy-6-metoxy-1,4-benzoquinol methylase
MTQHRTCLLCTSSELRPLAAYSRCHLVRCRRCDFVFVGRIPTDQELADHYVGLFDAHREGYDFLSPITAKRYGEWLDEFERYRSTNRILDVGCGVGHFLRHAIDRGWDAYGTEYPSDQVETCRGRGISMCQGALDPRQYEPASFDVVTSIEVIEHVRDPAAELAAIHSLIRPGGILYITTPNFGSLSRHLLREKWNVLSYPEHLSYFTVGTLSRELQKLGMRRVKAEATGFSFTRVRASLRSETTSFVAADQTDEKLRNALDGNEMLRRAKHLVDTLLTATSAGDAVKLTFQK